MKLDLMRHGLVASVDVDPQQGLTSEGRADIEEKSVAEHSCFKYEWKLRSDI